jgi:hypothetical protein
MTKAKQLLRDFFGPKIKDALQARNFKTVLDPSASEINKTKSMYEGAISARSFEVAAKLLGGIGDMMDVLGVIMLFTDAFYMKPEFQDYGQSEAKAQNGITPKLLTKENIYTALKFSISAQINGIKNALK